jgi:hypothetical protein
VADRTGRRFRLPIRVLDLESALAKLDCYDLLVLGDIAYVTKGQAETSAPFELIAARYERRPTLITASQRFGEWGKFSPSEAMTLAAVDRLVHHAAILEMNVESYRRRQALDRKRGRGRPPAFSPRLSRYMPGPTIPRFDFKRFRPTALRLRVLRSARG